MKIVSIVGARPQFVKAFLISEKLKKTGIQEIMVHTGQHYDFGLSGVFFDEFEMYEPQYYLGVGSGTHAFQTGNMLIKIEEMLLREKPDTVIVYGDTNTTLAGALAAAKLTIPLAHVEAGLRSYNTKMPEEINRVLTDRLSNILFVPTDAAKENLAKEGILKGVYQVGDVMFDVALQIEREVYEGTDVFLKKHGLQRKEFILVTIHRAENTDNEEKLRNIWDALKTISRNGIKIFFPVHPRTRKALEKISVSEKEKIHKNLILSNPVSYREMIMLEKNARVILTDSGGVQKEGYFFRTSCLILRNETEWVELIANGWNTVVGTEKDIIIAESLQAFSKEENQPEWDDFYGGGKASDRIVKVLGSYRK